MSSRNCHYGCRPPYNLGAGRPCAACMRKHERDMHQSWLDHQAEKAARAFDSILPATDREYEEYIDSVAPLVTDEFTFTLNFNLPD